MLPYPRCSIIKIWACAVDPQTPWTRVRVAVVTAQTAVTRASATSTASASRTAAMTMKTYVKVSCTLWIHHFVPCQLSSVCVFLPAGSTSCKGRCGETYNSQNKCHCNSKCTQYSNCCSDYADLCDGKAQQACPYVLISQLAFCLLFRHLANHKPRCQIVVKFWYSHLN